MIEVLHEVGPWMIFTGMVIVILSPFGGHK